MRSRLLFALNIAAVLVIMVIDWATPAGVVVGILACIPILLSSMADDRRQVWIIAGVAMGGFVVAAWLGAAPISPAAVWVPNRVLAFLSLPVAMAMALLLQKHRLDAVRARDAAVSAGELNRLLMSLLAHDLRAPLMLANQGFEYVQDSLAEEAEINGELIADIRARLQRSLRAIEVVLSLARADLTRAEGHAEEPPLAVNLRSEIGAEIDAFAYEASVRGKKLVGELDALGSRVYELDVLVLRQALAILLDNAVRYAVPGLVRVTAEMGRGGLEVRIADSGPGLSAHRRKGSGSGGSGLGLELCRTLVGRAGGSLDVERDQPTGTTFLLRLPAVALPDAPAERREKLLQKT